MARASWRGRWIDCSRTRCRSRDRPASPGLRQRQRGATARAVAEVRSLYCRQVPQYRPALPWYPVLRGPVAPVAWGGARRRDDYLRAQRNLDVPVISVGNLTMGGTGKTPCVLRLAELLHERGRRPGILTRGYSGTRPRSIWCWRPAPPSAPPRRATNRRSLSAPDWRPWGSAPTAGETGMLLRRAVRRRCHAAGRRLPASEAGARCRHRADRRARSLRRRRRLSAGPVARASASNCRAPM